MKSDSSLWRIHDAFTTCVKDCQSAQQLAKLVKLNVGHMTKSEFAYYDKCCERLATLYRKSNPRERARNSPTKGEREINMLFEPQINDDNMVNELTARVLYMFLCSGDIFWQSWRVRDNICLPKNFYPELEDFWVDWITNYGASDLSQFIGQTLEPYFRNLNDRVLPPLCSSIFFTAWRRFPWFRTTDVFHDLCYKYSIDLDETFSDSGAEGSSTSFDNLADGIEVTQLGDFEPQMLGNLFSDVGQAGLSDVAASFEDVAESLRYAGEQFGGLNQTIPGSVKLAMSSFDAMRDEMAASRGLAERFLNKVEKDDGVKVNHSVNVPSFNLTNVVELLWKNRGTIGVAITVGVAVYLKYKGDSCNARNMLMLGLMICGIAVVPVVVQKVDEFFHSCGVESEFEPHMADMDGLFKSGMFLLHSFLFPIKCRDETFAERLRGIINSASSFPKRYSDIYESLEGFITLFKVVLEKILEISGTDKSFMRFFDKYPKATILLEEASLLMKEVSEDPHPVDVRPKIDVLVHKIRDVLVQYKDDREFVGTSRLLQECLNKLETLTNELEVRGLGKDVMRVPPKTLLLGGPPGTGKSYVVKNLTSFITQILTRNDSVTQELMKKFGYKAVARDFVYSRNSSDKYWEGYRHQPIVVLDEVGAVRDMAGSAQEDGEMHSFLRMVNDVQYNLNMAHLDNKGKVDFTSQYIIGTTNQVYFKVESLNTPAAFGRRWTYLEVSVDPRFGMKVKDDNGHEYYRPDFDKIRKYIPSEDYDDFVAASMFLVFRKRKSLFAPGYDGHDMRTPDVYRLIQDQLRDRDREIKLKSDQYSVLSGIHERFLNGDFKEDYTLSPSVPAAAEGFEPQMDDYVCHCKVCTHSVTNYVEHMPDVMAYTDCAGGEVRITKEMYLKFLSEPFDTPDVLGQEWAPVRTRDGCLRQELLKYDPDKRNLSACIREHVRRWKFFCMTFYGNCKLAAYIELRKSLGEVLKLVGKFLLYFYSFKALFKIGELAKNHLFGRSKQGSDYEAQFRDQQSVDVAKKIVSRNVVCISDVDGTHRGFALFVEDNIMVVPQHYVRYWEDMVRQDPKKRLMIRRLGDMEDHQRLYIDVAVLLDPGTHFYFNGENSDVVAVYVESKVLQRFASIRQFVVNKRLGPEGELTIPDVDTDTLTWTLDVAPFTRHGPVSYAVGNSHFETDNVIAYRKHTRKGDCGIPFFLRDRMAGCNRLAGIHIAGSRAGELKGIGILYSQDTHDRIIEHFSAQGFFIIEAQMSMDPAILLDDDVSFFDLYDTPDEKRVPGKVNLGVLKAAPGPTKTSIVKGPLHGKLPYEPKTKPAFLRPFISRIDGELKDPEKIATSKYHKSMGSIDEAMVRVAVADYTDYIINSKVRRDDPLVEKRVLTFEEAVAGIPGVSFIDGIPRSTSAGYPLNTMNPAGFKGKQYFFGKEGDYTLDSTEAQWLRDRVQRVLDLAAEGKSTKHVFHDFSKDERRPDEKVEQGKTRKISGCDLVLTIAVRMHFGAFMKWYMDNRVENGSAIGVNVYSREIDDIVSYIGEDTRVIAGDYGNFDGSLPHVVLAYFNETVTAYYGDRGSTNWKIREVLLRSIINSVHINSEGVLYEWVGGNTSGNPLTTEINTWANHVIIRVACLWAMGVIEVKDAPPLLRKMRDYIRVICYGDDNMLGVSRDTQAFPEGASITQSNLTKVFAKMGFEYTDEAKGAAGLVSDDRRITDVSFLKRKFAKNSLKPSHKYVAPLALDTIRESIQWTRRRDQFFEDNKKNIEKMILELSLHDRKTFDEHVPVIVEAAREHLNWTPPMDTYRACQLAILDREWLWSH